jgi:hypothetical protein
VSNFAFSLLSWAILFAWVGRLTGFFLDRELFHGLRLRPKTGALAPCKVPGPLGPLAPWAPWPLGPLGPWSLGPLGFSLGAWPKLGPQGPF